MVNAIPRLKSLAFVVPCVTFSEVRAALALKELGGKALNGAGSGFADAVKCGGIVG